MYFCFNKIDLIKSLLNTRMKIKQMTKEFYLKGHPATHVIINVKCCGVESCARLTITLPKIYSANFICPELSFD